jgi:hypothetical protein
VVVTRIRGSGVRVSRVIHTVSVARIIDRMQMARVIHTVSVAGVGGRMTVFSYGAFLISSKRPLRIK